MTIEVWLPCPDHHGLYELSSLGRVRSCYFKPPRISKQGADSNGYPIVMLSKAGKRRPFTVHRLICRAFHGEPFSIWNEAAHLDGDRTNAEAANLKWVNKVENHFHQRAHGTHMAGELHPRARLTEGQVAEIRLARGRYREIAARFGISHRTVSDIRRGKRWKAATARASSEASPGKDNHA